VDQNIVAERERRKERREARRAKQRIENIGRAKKMHLARVAGEYSGKHLPSQQLVSAEPTFHIGCSGWFYWHWKDTFYPVGMPSKQWFSHYASKFRSVELNASFYSWPTINTVKSWIKQAGRRRFVYSVKVSELITHTLPRHEDADKGLWTNRRHTGSADGMLSIPTAAQLSLYARRALSPRFSARPETKKCRRVSSPQLAEQVGVRNF
jgi:hypothetical protein